MQLPGSCQMMSRPKFDQNQLPHLHLLLLTRAKHTEFKQLRWIQVAAEETLLSQEINNRRKCLQHYNR